MDDVFNEKPQDEQEAGTPPEIQALPESDSTVEQPQGEQPGSTTPTVDENGKHVPLAALEAERKGRQDWKEKALRYEGELKALREGQVQQPQGQQQPADPMERLQQQLVAERFNNSEMMVRMQYKDAGDVDDMINLFSEAAQKNPALQAELMNQRHPWLFAYQEGKRMKLAAEMGNDPDAYRKKLREEIEAEVRAQLGAAPPDNSNPGAPTSKPVIPGSLAGARSAAPRNASNYTGPTPLQSMFSN